MRRCVWLDRDDQGRPRCEHGWAHARGNGYWRCPLRHLEANRRYEATEKGRAMKARYNAADHARTSKALYDLGRIRVR